MSEFFRRRGLTLSAFALFICCIQLTGLSVRDPSLARLGSRAVSAVLFPFERLHHEFVASTRYVWSRYVFLIGVEEERDSLQSQVRELEALNSRFVEFKHENARLKELLHFSQVTGHRGLVATVVGRDSSNWIRTVTIDRGSADGVRPGLAVTFGNAIVGQTTVVNSYSSKVLLLTDNASAIDALVQGSRVAGVSEGVGDGSLKLRYAEQSPDHILRPGDRVIASGLDGVFPKGVLIGVVKRVSKAGSSLFQDVFVKPSVDVQRIENVMVLLPEYRHSMESYQLLEQEAGGLNPNVRLECSVTAGGSTR